MEALSHPDLLRPPLNPSRLKSGLRIRSSSAPASSQPCLGLEIHLSHSGPVSAPGSVLAVLALARPHLLSPRLRIRLSHPNLLRICPGSSSAFESIQVQPWPRPGPVSALARPHLLSPLLRIRLSHPDLLRPPSDPSQLKPGLRIHSGSALASSQPCLGPGIRLSRPGPVSAPRSVLAVPALARPHLLSPQLRIHLSHPDLLWPPPDPSRLKPGLRIHPGSAPASCRPYLGPRIHLSRPGPVSALARPHLLFPQLWICLSHPELLRPPSNPSQFSPSLILALSRPRDPSQPSRPCLGPGSAPSAFSPALDPSQTSRPPPASSGSVAVQPRLPLAPCRPGLLALCRPSLGCRLQL